MIWVLLVLYQLKHFIADYPLQSNQFMLSKFRPGWDFVPGLAAHAGVHAGLTLAICLAIEPGLWWLALVDFVIHFGMDRIKASPKLMGRWKALSAKDYRSMTTSVQDFTGSGNAELELGAKTYRKFLRGNTLFWIALGFDQMVHHLTHYFIIWMLVTAAL
jgi:hypothetical protein